MNQRRGLFWVAVIFTGLVTCHSLWSQVPTLPVAVANSDQGTQALAPLGQSARALDRAWILLASFLIFFMQPGFALLETGLARAKNAAHTMAMNVVIFGLATLCFWACGFAIMFGNWRTGWFLTGQSLDPDILALFLFQLMFLDTAATIPTGVLVERWRFLSFVAFGCFMSLLIYPIYGSWVWGHGWLAQLGRNLGLGHGFVDFAGSSVVHMVGGIAGLVGAYFLGARLGKFSIIGLPKPMPGHNTPMYMLGTFILAFGWFGFNAGNARSIVDPNLPRIAVNTMLAAAAGAVTALCYTWVNFKRPDPSFLCNGMLAGLVAITASCAYVAPWAAILIGSVAGVLVIWSCVFVERVLMLDDPVGAVSVHGTNGIWGVLALGLFADGTVAPRASFGVAGNVTGLLYGSGGQFLAQCIGVLVNLAWVGATSSLFFWLTGRIIGHRVSAQTEYQGLDVPELGVLGYTPQDAKVFQDEAVLQLPAQPRAASVPPNGHERFSILIEGVDLPRLTSTWSDLCQIGDRAPPAEFLAVYPYMTTVEGNRFQFRGGEPAVICANMERLFQLRMNGTPVRAQVVK